MNLKSTIFLGLLLLVGAVWSQETSEAVFLSKDFDMLEKTINQSQLDSIKISYAKLFLKKAKEGKDSIRIADGYRLLSLISYPDTLALGYADSIILFTKNLKDIKYPSIGYTIRGGVFYAFGEYKKALDEYIVALRYAKENKNVYQSMTLKFNIGLLKNNLGEREDAEKIFKEYLYFIESDKNELSNINYIKGLYALTNLYTHANKLNAADLLIDKGISLTLKKSDSINYSYFVLRSGINNYYKKNYAIAVDSLQKAKSFLLRQKLEETRIAVCNYYIGKSLADLNQRKNSIVYFKRVDSILNRTFNVTPEIIDAYNFLIADAKSRGDLRGQIKYINSLIKYDSILNTNYKYLKSTIVKEYDTPELILEKENLIYQMKEKQHSSKRRFSVLIGVVLLFFLLLIFFIGKNYANKKKFKRIIEDKKLRNLSDREGSGVRIIDDNTVNIGLDEELVKDILRALERFEKTTKFINKKYTLVTLAKELNTNGTYLSKVINVTKNVNFSSYLNNLKIDYSIDRLTNERSFRAYTIKAIAEGSGFSNAQSFSVAFHKKTGVYPSYFIKQLNKQHC